MYLIGAVIDASESSSDNELNGSPFGQSSHTKSEPCATCSTLPDLMQQHRDNLNLSGVTRMQVLREDIWNESVAIFKKPNFNLTASPRVKFEGEGGIDAGGLSREYGCLLQKVIFSAEANLFEGTSERKLPLYSIEGIYSRLFEVVGKMVAYLIVHLDIGIPCLSQAVYQYISTGSLEVAANYCSIDDINDYEMKELINKVQNQKQQWLCACCFNSIFSMKYWQMLRITINQHFGI